LIYYQALEKKEGAVIQICCAKHRILAPKIEEVIPEEVFASDLSEP